jgi:hypothetical protein
VATTKEPAVPARSNKDQVAWERAWAPKAIAGALVGGILPFIGAVINATSLADTPQNEPGQLLFYNSHKLAVIAPAILQGIGALGMGVVLYYLYQATKHRRPALPVLALYAAIGGPILLLVAQVASRGFLLVEASDFVSKGTFGYDEAKSAFRSTGPTVGAFATLLGVMALGFSFVLISLNSMRVGLQSRFMGVLGIITGVLLIIPLGSPIPIVQLFWFLGSAVLFTGRWPGGMPPAWTTGTAVPWPSRQQSMEARQRMAAQRGAAPEADVDEPDGEAPVAPGSSQAALPASQAGRRKKKKRR